METILAVLIFFAVFLIGVIFFLLAIYFAEKILSKTFTISSIFKNFKQKMWMTAGLGVFFFGFYFLIVLVGSTILSSQDRLNFFFLIYKYPIASIYISLFFFACCSIGIYSARLVIKYLYNRNKE